MAATLAEGRSTDIVLMQDLWRHPTVIGQGMPQGDPVEVARASQNQFVPGSLRAKTAVEHCL